MGKHRILFASCAILVFSSWLSAQSIQALPATSHVFPQVVDGFLSDGSSFASVLLMDVGTLVGTSTSCTLTGSMAERFGGSGPIKLDANSSIERDTMWFGQPFAQGFLQVNCSDPVRASLIITNYFPGIPDGSQTTTYFLRTLATVFSAKPITSSTLYLAPLAKFAVAIANANSVPVTVNVWANNVAIPNKQLTIGAQSQYVGFVDDIVGAAAVADSRAITLETLQTGAPFYVTALLYAGNSFTTLIPWGQ